MRFSGVRGQQQAIFQLLSSTDNGNRLTAYRNFIVFVRCIQMTNAVKLRLESSYKTTTAVVFVFVFRC